MKKKKVKKKQAVPIVQKMELIFHTAFSSLKKKQKGPVQTVVCSISLETQGVKSKHSDPFQAKLFVSKSPGCAGVQRLPRQTTNQSCACSCA